MKETKKKTNKDICVILLTTHSIIFQLKNYFKQNRKQLVITSFNHFSILSKYLFI